jgi:hypothetical protein
MMTAGVGVDPHKEVIFEVFHLVDHIEVAAFEMGIKNQRRCFELRDVFELLRKYRLDRSWLYGFSLSEVS